MPMEEEFLIKCSDCGVGVADPSTHKCARSNSRPEIKIDSKKRRTKSYAEEYDDYAEDEYSDYDDEEDEEDDYDDYVQEDHKRKGKNKSKSRRSPRPAPKYSDSEDEYDDNESRRPRPEPTSASPTSSESERVSPRPRSRRPSADKQKKLPKPIPGIYDDETFKENRPQKNSRRSPRSSGGSPPPSPPSRLDFYDAETYQDDPRKRNQEKKGQRSKPRIQDSQNRTPESPQLPPLTNRHELDAHYDERSRAQRQNSATRTQKTPLHNPLPTPPANRPQKPELPPKGNEPEKQEKKEEESFFSRSYQMLFGKKEETQVESITGTVAISEITTFSASMTAATCSGCRKSLRPSQDYVTAGPRKYHTLCCECPTCGLSVAADPYGSEGWTLTDGTSIKCGECNKLTSKSSARSRNPSDSNGHHSALRQTMSSEGSSASSYNIGLTPEEAELRRRRKTCATCGNSLVKSGKVCEALGKRYHLACFACGFCGEKFDNRNFYVYQNTPACRMCYHERRGTICQGCSNPIEGNCVVVREQYFHSDCFVCVACREPLTHSYYTHNHEYYCGKDIRVIEKKYAMRAERRMTTYKKI